MKSSNAVNDNLKSKRKLAGALLAERGLMANKADVLSGYGVERIRDLSGPQLDQLIDGLRAIPRKDTRADAPAEIRKARSVVLNLLDDLGIKAKNGNWKPVNDYLLQPRIAGKVLYSMTEEELKTCAVRLRQVVKWRKDKAADIERQAREN